MRVDRGPRGLVGELRVEVRVGRGLRVLVGELRAELRVERARRDPVVGLLVGLALPGDQRGRALALPGGQGDRALVLPGGQGDRGLVARGPGRRVRDATRATRVSPRPTVRAARGFLEIVGDADRAGLSPRHRVRSGGRIAAG